MKRHEGRYAVLIEHENRLTIELTAAGREELAELLERHTSRDKQGWCDYEYVYELLEDFTGNGWCWLRPEDLDALTDCQLILTDDATIEDDSSTTVHGSVWWHSRYQVENAAIELEQHGKVVFAKA